MKKAVNNSHLFIASTIIIIVLVFSIIASSVFIKNMSINKVHSKNSVDTMYPIKQNNSVSFDADLLENINPLNNLKIIQDCLNDYKNKPNDILPLNDFQILTHKAGDLDEKYANANISAGEPNSDCYIEYNIFTLGEGEYYDQNVKACISLRENKTKYFIEISRPQQEEIWQKLIDDKFFELDNMYSDPILGYFRSKISNPQIKTPHQDYWSIDFRQITAMKVGAIDDTQKNKEFFDSFFKWFKDKYDPLLLANPCKDNLFPDDLKWYSPE